MVFVKSKDATSYYNVSDSTLRKWAREKLIRTETTKGGHWRYWIEDKSQQSNTPQNEQLSNYIIYTRVSSKKQSRNLDKQSIFLKSKFPNYTLITDIGSGINYNRKGFPYWNNSSKEISKKLWLPIKIGSQDSASTSSNGCSLSSDLYWKQWRNLMIKNQTTSQQTSWKYSLSLLQDITEKENTIVTRKVKIHTSESETS